VVSPFVPRGQRSGKPYTPYSLLRTTEEMLGLTPLLGNAAQALSMRTGLGL
jgi:phosphatidylinositol-3-phosphatase